MVGNFWLSKSKNNIAIFKKHINDFGNPKSTKAQELKNTTNFLGMGSLFLGLLSGVGFSKQEKKGNIFNKILRVIELNV